MPTQTLFEMTAGDDKAIKVRLIDTSGEPVAINDYTFQSTMKMRPDTSDEDAPVRIDAVPDLSELGLVYLVFPHDQTINLKPGYYLTDIQVVSAGGIVKTLLSGRVRVHPNITQRTAQLIQESL